MNCELARARMEELARLSVAERAELEEHIARCSECRGLWETELAIQRALQAYGERSPSRQLERRILEIPRRRSPMTSLWPLSLPAMALVCVLATLALWQVLPWLATLGRSDTALVVPSPGAPQEPRPAPSPATARPSFTGEAKRGAAPGQPTATRSAPTRLAWAGVPTALVTSSAAPAAEAGSAMSDRSSVGAPAAATAGEAVGIPQPAPPQPIAPPGGGESPSATPAREADFGVPPSPTPAGRARAPEPATPPAGPPAWTPPPSPGAASPTASGPGRGIATEAPATPTPTLGIGGMTPTPSSSPSGEATPIATPPPAGPPPSSSPTPTTTPAMPSATPSPSPTASPTPSATPSPWPTPSRTPAWGVFPGLESGLAVQLRFRMAAAWRGVDGGWGADSACCHRAPWGAER